LRISAKEAIALKRKDADDFYMTLGFALRHKEEVITRGIL
jgi:hypothetical protein